LVSGFFSTALDDHRSVARQITGPGSNFLSNRQNRRTGSVCATASIRAGRRPFQSHRASRQHIATVSRQQDRLQLDPQLTALWTVKTLLQFIEYQL